MIRDTCHPTDPTRSCAARYEAQDRGSFWPSTIGWLWSGSMDVLRPWATCPFCEAPLPVLTPTLLRVMDDPCEDGEGWEG